MGVQVKGRINWDVKKLVEADIAIKLRSYSLNGISREFLGDQKIDLSFWQMNKMQSGTPQDRGMYITFLSFMHMLGTIVKYCLKDCVLPHQLSVKLKYFMRTIELARVTGTPIEWLIHKGMYSSYDVLHVQCRASHQMLIANSSHGLQGKLLCSL